MSRLGAFTLALSLFAALASPEAAASDERPVSSVPAPTERALFDGPLRGSWEPPKETYPGEFNRNPVIHWTKLLPGEVLNAAAHTERARPVFYEDKILVGSAAAQGLFVLERWSGNVVRSFPAESSVESEPLVQNGRVYFTDTGGRTWCYDLDSGDLIWSHNSGAPILVRPVIVDGTVYVTNVEDLVVALDAITGELSWRYQRRADLMRRSELRLYAAPPATDTGTSMLVGFSDGSLVALDKTSGDALWEKQVGIGVYPDLVAEPLIDEGLIFTSAYFEPLVAIDTETLAIRWESPHGSADASLLLREQDVMKVTLTEVERPPGLRAEGSSYQPEAQFTRETEIIEGETTVLYHPGSDGVLRKLNALTGAELWAWDSDTNSALAQPVLLEQGLLVAESTGTMTLVDPQSGVELWKWSTGVRLEGVTRTPVIDGRQLLFITNAGFLYSVLAPPKDAPWPEGANSFLQTQKPSPRR